LNLLECYLKEIKSVTPYISEWTNKYAEPFVAVDLVYNCYNGINRTRMVWSVSRWEQIKKDGYFML
jgi:hypothetical protein